MKFTLVLSLLFCSYAFVESVKQGIPALDSYNPGLCNEITHGKEVLVKNRLDKEIILICVNDKSVYKWKPTDGFINTAGEFFNPGLNCSDILDKLEDAKDGFYWIILKSLNIVQVYCDMTTDGGGYHLVGHKKTAVTWTVPSNSQTVEPYGNPHWSSSLGDLPILDFRVQVATKEDFKATKAHWSYRLKSKRPLKQLMTNTDGCNQRSAGIGNIAYVKNLLTKSIATTTLRCSRFGHAYSHSLGWHKMNLCLQTPCPSGFVSNVSQVDFDGGFSFSTTGSKSGMYYNATASVGCDNKQCCGCFGPVGGTKDYCAENCKAINGGIVTKNVFTWFWVRSSLPKRLWKKCMDYQVKRNDGKLISYKLVGHDVLPVEGRCNEGSTLLHDGIVVVPDSSAAQKVPAVDGLLQFRKDKQELLVRSNKTWNVLAPENKILQETLERVKKLKHNSTNETKNILQETDKKYKLNLNKITKLEEKVGTEKKFILNETDRKYKLNLDKINKLDKTILNETDKLDKKIVYETDKKYQLNLDKINKLEKKLEILMKRLSYTPTTGIKTTVLPQHIECFGYKWLNESSRNRKYSVSATFCDRSLLSGWYRFGSGAGIKIAATCVPKHRCGAHAPGWMNGVHPTFADGKVTRKVCYHWNGNCCNWSNNIEVVNCGQYYVYKLSAPSAGCSLRYCGSDY